MKIAGAPLRSSRDHGIGAISVFVAGGHVGTVGPAHARAGADAPALGLVRWGGRGAGVVGAHTPEGPRGLLQ